MRNKDLPTNPVVSLSDLQRACHRIAQLLDLRGYKIEIYKPQRISIRNPNIYSKETVFQFKKVKHSWVHSYVWIECCTIRNLNEPLYFTCMDESDYLNALSVLPTNDAISVLRIRDELLYLCGILNSYQIPSQYYIDGSFYNCMQKSWRKLGRKFIYIN